MQTRFRNGDEILHQMNCTHPSASYHIQWTHTMWDLVCDSLNLINSKLERSFKAASFDGCKGQRLLVNVHQQCPTNKTIVVL